jgi:dTDP-4-amino-4,6-dideoxygalactose transaminase
LGVLGRAASHFYHRSIDVSRCKYVSEATKGERSAADLRLPVREMAARQVLSLPVHPVLSTEDLTTLAREVVALCD